MKHEEGERGKKFWEDFFVLGPVVEYEGEDREEWCDE